MSGRKMCRRHHDLDGQERLTLPVLRGLDFDPLGFGHPRHAIVRNFHPSQAETITVRRIDHLIWRHQSGREVEWDE